VGLGMFIVTVVGGMLLFGLAFVGTLLGLVQLGFQPTDAMGGLVVVVACLALLVLWPVVYLLRWLYHKIRKQDMPPVRPDIIVPRGLVIGTKVLFGIVVVAGLTLVTLGGFLNLALMGYVPLDRDGRAALGTATFTSGTDAGLPVWDVAIQGPAGAQWTVDDQTGEQWQVDCNVFTLEPAVVPLLQTFSIRPCARPRSLMRRDGPGTPALRCIDLGGTGFFEGILETLAPFLDYGMIHHRSVPGEPLAPAKARTAYTIAYQAGGALLQPTTPKAPGAGEEEEAGTATTLPTVTPTVTPTKAPSPTAPPTTTTGPSPTPTGSDAASDDDDFGDF